MSTHETARLRTALATTERTGRGRAYPPSLRAEVLRHARARITAGEAASVIATDLGLHAATLASWIGRASPAPAAFASVDVLAEPPASPGALVVHTPQGLRIDGLDLDSLVTLLRRLA
jgi:hypothetical protein